MSEFGRIGAGFVNTSIHLAANGAPVVWAPRDGDKTPIASIRYGYLLSISSESAAAFRALAEAAKAAAEALERSASTSRYVCEFDHARHPGVPCRGEVRQYRSGAVFENLCDESARYVGGLSTHRAEIVG